MHEHPKILLVDLRDDSEDVLRKQGYNVEAGTFGTPYKVPRSDQPTPIIASASLPDYTEQEVVVVDLGMGEPADAPATEKHTSDGKNDWWTTCSDGLVDPRPRVMYSVQDAFDRILAHGGIFVVFAEARRSQETQWGHVQRGYGFVAEKKIPCDNWCFLSLLSPSRLVTVRDVGKEIVAAHSEGELTQLVREHSRGAWFSCTVKWQGDDRWFTLATNKYGDPVAGAIAVANGEAKPLGCVLILPPMSDRPRFLSRLLTGVLPDVSPHLFPDVEGARWVERDEYELPGVMELQQQILRVQEQANAQVASLEKAIVRERIDHAYLHDLIRETGPTLVAAAKKALEVVGFQSVVDVDEELAQLRKHGRRREDLRIDDVSPTVLVEVKGLNGVPKESDSLQVWRYLSPRMKQLGRTDIRGLSIVNHQRSLPALERENGAPFGDDVLTNASEHDVGLLTAWDLYRLVRGYIKNGWRHEQVRGIFYQNGRIAPIPTHYRLVGIVEDFWPHAGAVGIMLDGDGISRGDRIAFELPADFEEQAVESLQVDKQPVDDASVGQLAGVKTHLTGDQARKGTRVYKVSSTPREVQGGQ